MPQPIPLPLSADRRAAAILAQALNDAAMSRTRPLATPDDPLPPALDGFVYDLVRRRRMLVTRLARGVAGRVIYYTLFDQALGLFVTRAPDQVRA